MGEVWNTFKNMVQGLFAPVSYVVFGAAGLAVSSVILLGAHIGGAARYLANRDWSNIYKPIVDILTLTYNYVQNAIAPYLGSVVYSARYLAQGFYKIARDRTA